MEQKSKRGPRRLAWMDVLRAIATVFVICVHTVSLAAAEFLPGSPVFRVLDLFTYTFLSCNGLFLMLSGALLLPVRGERAGTFFAKRFTKAALPLAVYYVFYVCAKEGLQWLYPANWLVLLQRILSGEPYEAPHFWLVYVILELYLMTPPLRWLLERVPDFVLPGVISVVFAAHSVELYFSIYGRRTVLSGMVGTSAGIFLLGYFLSGRCTERAERLFLSAGALSYAVSCFQILCTDTYRGYFDRNAPSAMLFAAAIFLAVKRAAAGKERVGRLTGLLSKYSFSILLIHWGILHFVVKKILNVDVTSLGIVGGCLLATVLTLFLSLAGAAVVDHLLIFPLQAFWRKAGAVLAGKKETG